jgi:hypothetical protein
MGPHRDIGLLEVFHRDIMIATTDAVVVKAVGIPLLLLHSNNNSNPVFTSLLPVTNGLRLGIVIGV